MIKIPAYLSGFSSRSDGSAGIRFTTQEISPDDFVNLKRDLNLFGWLVFKENGVQEEDIPDEDVSEGKRPSQRLRAVLYVLHQQSGGKKEDFEGYYREQVNKIIEHIKGKLDQ